MQSGSALTGAAGKPGGPAASTFADRLEDHGDRTAFVDERGLTVSYRELARRADAFAAALSGARRLLVVETLNQLPPLVAYLGALRGRHPVILSEDGSTARDRRIVEAFLPHAVFRRRGSNWRLEPTSRLAETPLHEDLALLLSTSGSTGSPKLVRLSHENIGSNAAAIARYLQLDASERPVTALPFHYSYGMSVINSHLEVGATILLTDASVAAPELWDLFRDRGGTSFAGVPYTFELLDRMGFRDASWPSLRGMTQAGGRMAPEKVRAWASWARQHGVRFHVMYGQTEAAPRMAHLPPEVLPDCAECIGQPIPGGSFELRDEAGAAIAGPEQVGELVYRGPNVMLGYAQARADLARGREVTELITGDLACRNDRGLYRLVGRKSRFSKLAGLRIAHDEVEALLGREGIAAAATGDDRGIVVCTPMSGSTERIEDLLHRQYGLGGDAVAVLERPEHPVLPSGKLDYRAMLLEARGAADRGLAGKHPAADPAASQAPLREVFRRMLRGREVRPTDTFVSLGGDSLSHVQVSLAIERRLGYLPRRWETIPLGELEAMRRRDPAPPGLPTEVVVRVLSILGVLLVHATDLRFPGGSDVLMILAGYSFARYQKARLHAGTPGPILLQYLKRVILPYYLIAIPFAFASLGWGGLKKLPWIATVYYHPGQIEHLWFLQVLFHAVIIYSVLFAIPVFRRWARACPWSSGLAILAGGVALHLCAHDINMVGLYNRDTLLRFYLFAFGWCLELSASRRQKLACLALALLLVWTYLPDIPQLSRYVWVVAATALLLGIDRIAVARRLHAPLTLLAKSSFYIYLLQFLAIDLLDAPTVRAWQVPLVVIEAIALGIAAWKLVQLLDALWQRRAASRRRQRQPVASRVA